MRLIEYQNSSRLMMMLSNLLTAKIRVFLSFFLYAFVLAAIFPRLGDLQLKMGISEGTLGAVLIGFALGAQISLMFAGPLIEHFGFRTIFLAGIPILGFAEFAATLAPTPFTFFLCLTIGGLAIGAIEIIVNLEADRTEHLLKKRIMNRAHAFWSFGFFAAGMAAAAIAQLGIDPAIHLFVMSTFATILSFILFWNFDPAPPRSSGEKTGPKFVKPTSAIMLLVAFTLSAMLLEGAGADWSVIYMRDVFDTPPFINSLALAFGALTQAFVRYFADGFVDRRGPVKIAKTLIATLGLGTLLVAFAPNPMVALLGFALMGAGTSVVFPLAMSAAAQRTDRPAATNVAALAQLAFITFLIAPPILGFIAEHFGIRVSFGIGLPLIVLSWFTLHSIDPKIKT
ncbi:MAG: MFS transporter [Rhizobiaceae bacterium]